MTSYIPQTIQDTLNSLITQITNVYKAFITHTKIFFISPNQDNIKQNDGNINASGDINLVSNAGMINLQSDNTIALSANNNLLIGTVNDNPSFNDLTIHSYGNLFVGSNTQSITLMQTNLMQTNQTGTNPLCILWGSGEPTYSSYSRGSLYISTTGKLYIYNGEWKSFVIST
jgi:hypothetical protein